MDTADHRWIMQDDSMVGMRPPFVAPVGQVDSGFMWHFLPIACHKEWIGNPAVFV